jgi:hypothetical protein
MQLKHVIDTLDGLDQAIAQCYRQLENGKYALQTDENLEIKAALAKEREYSKSLKRQYADLDPDEYARLKDDAARREAEYAKRRGDFEKLEKQMAARHQEEIGKYKAELDAIRRERAEAFLGSEIASAIASANGIPEILEPIIARQVKAVERDGKLGLSVTDGGGQPRIKDGAGSPFTISDLVSELRANPTFGPAFRGSGASGAGTHPAAAGAAPTSARARMDALGAKESLTQPESLELIRLAGQVRAELSTATA